MLALSGDWDQIDLFPCATQEEIKSAKSILQKYKRMKSIVEDFERMGTAELNSKQLGVYTSFKHTIQTVERAVKLIIDDEIRRIMERRYLTGQPHYIIVSQFSIMHPSTVDRKINKGIESVANSIKLWS